MSSAILQCTVGQRPTGAQKRLWFSGGGGAQVLRAVGFSELKKVEEKFKLGIRVYEPSEAGIWRLIRQPAHYEAVGVEPMTIGWYGDHAFLIKKIKNVKSCYPTAGSSDVLTAGNFSVPSCSCNGHIITFHVDGQQTSNTYIIS